MACMTTSTMAEAFKNYYESTKDVSTEKRGILCYESDTWKVKPIDIKEIRRSRLPMMETVEKIVSSDLTGIKGFHIEHWIQTFNFFNTLKKLKKNEIVPIKGEEKVEFCSYNKYAWLSNFFSSLVYDPTYNLIYPSVESGYVAFKAREGNKNEKEIIELSRIIDPRQVKQEGADLWERENPEDEQLAIREMARLVKLKFEQNPLLSRLLISSKAYLEEYTGDSFWGSAYGKGGSNHLGNLIREVREKLNH